MLLCNDKLDVFGRRPVRLFMDSLGKHIGLLKKGIKEAQNEKCNQ